MAELPDNNQSWKNYESEDIKSLSKALTVGLLWSITGLLPPKNSANRQKSENAESKD